MQFTVGDIIHNRVTEEEGRVVRIAEIGPDRVGYIVAIGPDANWYFTGREALWPESQVKE